jgi:hypothetical protein
MIDYKEKVANMVDILNKGDVRDAFERDSGIISMYLFQDNPFSDEELDSFNEHLLPHLGYVERLVSLNKETNDVVTHDNKLVMSMLPRFVLGWALDRDGIRRVVVQSFESDVDQSESDWFHRSLNDEERRVVCWDGKGQRLQSRDWRLNINVFLLQEDAERKLAKKIARGGVGRSVAGNAASQSILDQNAFAAWPVFVLAGCSLPVEPVLSGLKSI